MNKPAELVLGIDGGGTRTRAALVAGDGTLLGCGIGGPSNLDDAGFGGVRAGVETAVSAAWHMSGIARRQVDTVFLGMAGVLTLADAAVICNVALDLQLASVDCIAIDHDIRTALAGGLAGDPGIAIIAGTGSSCYGRMDDGRSWIAGGWGCLDDLGSAWHLGQRAMTAAAQAYDGRGEATALQEAVCLVLGLDCMPEILHRIHVTGLSRAGIAGLAPLVIEVAMAGDGVAAAIASDGAEELARMAAAVAERLNAPSDVAITAVGGLVTGAPYYRQILAGALQKRLPGCRFDRPRLPPVLGAALLALECAGVARTPQLIATMETMDIGLQ